MSTAPASFARLSGEAFPCSSAWTANSGEKKTFWCWIDFQIISIREQLVVIQTGPRQLSLHEWVLYLGNCYSSVARVCIDCQPVMRGNNGILVSRLKSCSIEQGCLVRGLRASWPHGLKFLKLASLRHGQWSSPLSSSYSSSSLSSSSSRSMWKYLKLEIYKCRDLAETETHKVVENLDNRDHT